MNRELYLTLLLFTATLAAIGGFLVVLSPFFLPIAWALCLAAISFKRYVRLAEAWHRPRLAALTMVLLTALLLIVPAGVVLYAAGHEVVRLGQQGIQEWETTFRSSAPKLYQKADEQLKELGVDGGVEEVATNFAKQAPAVLWAPVARGVGNVLRGVFAALMGLFLMLVTQYFVYTEGPHLTAWVRSLLPLSKHHVDEVLETLRNTTSAAVIGGLLVALFQGFLGGVGYVVVGIQAPVLWGLLTALFSLLPVGGSAIVWAPMVVYLFVTGDTGHAWLLLGWGVIVVGGADNLVRPWMLRRTGARVHPMLLFFAILSGIGLFGVSGVVFGPLLIAVLMTLTRMYGQLMADTAPA